MSIWSCMLRGFIERESSFLTVSLYGKRERERERETDCQAFAKVQFSYSFSL